MSDIGLAVGDKVFTVMYDSVTWGTIADIHEYYEIAEGERRLEPGVFLEQSGRPFPARLVSLTAEGAIDNWLSECERVAGRMRRKLAKEQEPK